MDAVLQLLRDVLETRREPWMTFPYTMPANRVRRRRTE